MNAEWSEAPANGVSYRHPRPFTITDIQIVNVCATHAALVTDPLPSDPYFRPDPTADNGKYSGGYLCVGAACIHPDPSGRPLHTPKPYAELTDAERLYVHLYRYSGGLVRWDTCECRSYACGDRLEPETVSFPHHPVHPRHKCRFHELDDDEHTQARQENVLKNVAVTSVEEALQAKDPILTAQEIEWSFDAARNLIVTVPTRILLLATERRAIERELAKISARIVLE